MARFVWGVTGPSRLGAAFAGPAPPLTTSQKLQGRGRETRARRGAWVSGTMRGEQELEAELEAVSGVRLQNEGKHTKSVKKRERKATGESQGSPAKRLLVKM